MSGQPVKQSKYQVVLTTIRIEICRNFLKWSNWPGFQDDWFFGLRRKAFLAGEDNVVDVTVYPRLVDS